MQTPRCESACCVKAGKTENDAVALHMANRNKASMCFALLCKYSDLTGLYILKGLSLENNLLVSTGSTQNNKDIKRVNDEKRKHTFLSEEGGDQN